MVSLAQSQVDRNYAQAAQLDVADTGDDIAFENYDGAVVGSASVTRALSESSSRAAVSNASAR